MAEFINPIGTVRGKFGNVVAYMGANGKNFCKSRSFSRKPISASQRERAAAFAAVVSRKWWMKPVIQLGFPGNRYPKGGNGFTSANVLTAVTVEKVESNKVKKHPGKILQEYRGVIDFSKLRVAAGGLVMPSITVEVNVEQREVRFVQRGLAVESIDCFLDDEIYGVLLYEPNQRCKIERLGIRGEDISKGMQLPEKMEVEGMVIYVFARTADGKEVSDSMCLQEC